MSASTAQLAHGNAIDGGISVSTGGQQILATDRERWEQLRNQIQALHTTVQSMAQRRGSCAAHPATSNQLMGGCKSGSATIVESSMAQLAKRCLSKQATPCFDGRSNSRPRGLHG
mmetsp:Transcript_50248/g.99927  ORF Transcript_50248/g.99927 Transcript_50248/m.99927 type:complete len:115 (+) Transcript_50248:261-605(+)